MTETKIEIKWEEQAQKKYQNLIAKIPMFHRAIAKEVVDKQAVINAKERSSELIEESDIVRAFFSEVQMTFYSLMIRLFEDAGIDYAQYDSK